MNLGSAAVSGGTATLATASLAVGTHTITARYDGSTSFPASTSSGWTVIVAAPPTATPSNTATVTATFTETQTPTVTSTVTATGTATFTPTVTDTPTATRTETTTSTPTATATATATDTATPTVTATASDTATSTPTTTATSTATDTRTSTATPTATSTSTPTGTATSTSTPSNTATVTPTAMSTSTATPTATPTSTDIDGDGDPNTVEDGAPSGGDGNGDGIPDRLQASVVSLPAAEGGGYLTVVASGPDGCGELHDVYTMREPSVGTDAAYLYPFGLVHFAIACAGSSTVTVIAHRHTAPTRSMAYRKFGPRAPDFDGTQAFYTLPDVVFDTTPSGAMRATFTLTDNQLGDGSGMQGLIVDPSGPAMGTGPAPAPALSFWGLAAALALVVVQAGAALRRRRMADTP